MATTELTYIDVLTGVGAAITAVVAVFTLARGVTRTAFLRRDVQLLNEVLALPDMDAEVRKTVLSLHRWRLAELVARQASQPITPLLVFMPMLATAVLGAVVTASSLRYFSRSASPDRQTLMEWLVTATDQDDRLAAVLSGVAFTAMLAVWNGQGWSFYTASRAQRDRNAQRFYWGRPIHLLRVGIPDMDPRYRMKIRLQGALLTIPLLSSGSLIVMQTMNIVDADTVATMPGNSEVWFLLAVTVLSAIGLTFMLVRRLRRQMSHSILQHPPLVHAAAILEGK